MKARIRIQRPAPTSAYLSDCFTRWHYMINHDGRCATTTCTEQVTVQYLWLYLFFPTRTFVQSCVFVAICGGWHVLTYAIVHRSAWLALIAKALSVGKDVDLRPLGPKLALLEQLTHLQ
jgi:hypothetical protein